MQFLSQADINLANLGERRQQKGISFSLLIPARGRDALESLPAIVAANRKAWMDDQDVLCEIGVSIDPDPEGLETEIAHAASEAGASWVVFNRDVINRHSPMEKPGAAGKAGNIRSLALLARGDRLIFHDSDLTEYDPATVGNLVFAMLGDNEALFANGASARRSGNGTPGGRTTEMLRAVFSKQLYRHVPGFVNLVQPLLGEFAIDAQLFAVLPFSRGYGIETSLKALAIDAVGADRACEVELPTKSQNGQDYLNLVKQFHEISFTVDVLETYFERRAMGDLKTPAHLASEYYDRHPGRTIELQRPAGYDDIPFTPRMGFYEPLAELVSHRRRFSSMNASIFERFSTPHADELIREIGQTA